MIRFMIVAASALFLTGCDFGAERRLMPVSPSSLSPPLTPVPPTPVPPPTPPPISGEIPVGVDFTDVFDGRPKWYSVRAPSSGTLVASLRWDPHASAPLALGMGHEWFYGSYPDWSPITGRVPVSAGETCLVGVELAQPWDYGSTPIVITITIE